MKIYKALDKRYDLMGKGENKLLQCQNLKKEKDVLSEENSKIGKFLEKDEKLD